MTATIIVWVLVMTGDFRGGSIVIDNISSRENCEAVARQLQDAPTYRHSCIAVRKAATP